MSLFEVRGPSEGRWERPLKGSLDRLMVRSELLEENPLRDPALRPLFVYRPRAADDGTGERLPSVYVLQGFGGLLEEWLAPTPSGPTAIERLDAMFSSGECPPALVVFVDASTSWGGSQFLNSPACGRYLDYLCDEVIPFIDTRYPTLDAREHRGVSGKSSGGYGAMVIPMLRPGVFGALASHAGDALFECCYQPFFPVAARLLRSHFEGSWEAFEGRAMRPDFDWRQFAVLFAAYGMACAYTPDPNRPADRWCRSTRSGARSRRSGRSGLPSIPFGSRAATSVRLPACAGSTSTRPQRRFLPRSWSRSLLRRAHSTRDQALPRALRRQPRRSR